MSFGMGMVFVCSAMVAGFGTGVLFWSIGLSVGYLKRALEVIGG